MVDASELAFRSLVQDFGCDLGYTPMMHGALMSRDPNYRERQVSCNLLFCCLAQIKFSAPIRIPDF
jgi:tRNA-dihydrouridine synthase